MNFSLTVNDCNQIKELTRLQSQSKEWYLYRSGRITASRAKDVCSVKTYNSNISLIKSICYPLNNKFKNAATEWGNTNESNGRLLYTEKLQNTHIHFSVTESGLVINSNIPYMGASPDGRINCD